MTRGGPRPGAGRPRGTTKQLDGGTISVHLHGAIRTAMTRAIPRGVSRSAYVGRAIAAYLRLTSIAATLGTTPEAALDRLDPARAGRSRTMDERDFTAPPSNASASDIDAFMRRRLAYRCAEAVYAALGYDSARPLWEHLGSDRRAALASAALSQIEAQP